MASMKKLDHMDRVFSIIINLESLFTWKYNRLLQNINLEISLLTWKNHYELGKITINLEIKLIVIFQVENDVSKSVRISKLIIRFPS